MEKIAREAVRAVGFTLFECVNAEDNFEEQFVSALSMSCHIIHKRWIFTGCFTSSIAHLVG